MLGGMYGATFGGPYGMTTSVIGTVNIWVKRALLTERLEIFVFS